MPPSIPVYALTLERTPDRAAAIQTGLQASGFAGRLFFGTDGSRDLSFPHSGLSRPYCSHWGRPSSWMACAESHLSIYRHALTADPAAPALIFEDDVEIFRPAADFLRVIADAPPEWDVIHFHTVAEYDPITYAPAGSTPDLARMTVPGYGCVAYAISPRAMNLALQDGYPIRRPIDIQLPQLRLNFYRTHAPFTSRDGHFLSTIR